MFQRIPTLVLNSSPLDVDFGAYFTFNFLKFIRTHRHLNIQTNISNSELHFEIATRRIIFFALKLIVKSSTVVSSGQFLLMDSSDCEEGDTVALASDYVGVNKLHVLEFAYYMNLKEIEVTASLSVEAFFTTNGLLYTQLATISWNGIRILYGVDQVATRSTGGHGWKYLAFVLRPGKYYIGFKGTCGLPYESNIAIDYVRLREVTEEDNIGSSIQHQVPLDVTQIAREST